MFIIGLILCIFFVIVISLLVKAYSDDVRDLEFRILQLEKRISSCENKNVGGETDMPCGTKGRPRGRHTTSRGGGRKR